MNDSLKWSGSRCVQQRDEMLFELYQYKARMRASTMA
jgi:hypothetical protein